MAAAVRVADGYGTIGDHPNALPSMAWRDRDGSTVAGYAVDWQRRPIASIKTSWARAVALAVIEGDPTPHTESGGSLRGADFGLAQAPREGDSIVVRIVALCWIEPVPTSRS